MALLRAWGPTAPELPHLARVCGLLHTSSLAQLALQQPVPPTGPPAPKALVVRPLPLLLERSLASALNALHRLVLLLGSIKHSSANEAYVRRYLEGVGLDSFTLEHLSVTHRALFRLSVARDIEPAISWLRSVGVDGEALAELVRHTPAMLSASVEEQLEPLAALVRQAGGSPGAVLLACPDIAQVPVASLRGTRHVLHQLGASDNEISLLLLSLPDLYADLALALHRLFADLGVAAWKLHSRQRRQYGGMVPHHLSHWNRGKPATAAADRHTADTGASAAGQAWETAAAGGGARLREGSSDERDAGEAGRRAVVSSRLRAPMGSGRLPGSGSLLLRTSYVLDMRAYHGILRAVSALEALAQQAEGSAGQRTAVLRLQDVIDELAGLAEPDSGSRDGARLAA